MKSLADAVIGGALAALTLSICLYFAPRGFHVGFVDMGHDGYQLRQVLDLTGGGVIFRDTFDQYGPLNGYLNAVGFIALGRRLLAIKYFISLWYGLIVVALYVLARHWLSPALAAFSALIWLSLAPFYNHGIMISPHAYTLLFQALATLVALRTPGLGPRRFALIGLLAGLSWAVKQSMGALYLLAIVSYLFYRLLLNRSEWRRVAMATVATSAVFFAVVGLSLALLWSQDALHDWYFQTIEFPRAFYLPGSSSIDVASHPSWLAAFARAQWTQPIYWIVIRAVVFLTVIAQIIGRRPADDLVLIASITAFLWLGAYPSGNFMHQWWTASLAIPAFVVCVRYARPGTADQGRIVSGLTVAIVLLIVGAGLDDRMKHTRWRARTLTETLGEPAVFRGIRTDVPTRRAFETLYHLMARYRADHPGTKVVSIESSDGSGGGMVESLPFISFFDDNPHSQPVYWSLPVLSTTVYPRYSEALWRQVRDEHPLLVDHRIGRYKPFRISGYDLLAAAQSDYGHWYVYAPTATVPVVEGSLYLAADGSTERGFPDDEDSGPELAKRLSTSSEGAWRGRVRPSAEGNDSINSADAYPLDFVDPVPGKGAGPVSVYTWPEDLPGANFDGPVEPVPTDVVWRAGRGDIVRDFQPGAWIVDGFAQDPFGYLLQWAEQPVDSGTRLVVRGEVFEGGLQVGFLEHGTWAGFVCVARPGRFQAVLETQDTGRSTLVAANCVRAKWWERAALYPMRAILGPFMGGAYRNHLLVSQAGWIRPSAPTSTTPPLKSTSQRAARQ